MHSGREQATLNLVKRYNAMQEEFGFESMPVRGPMPLEDIQGARPAMGILRRSLDPGRNAATIQFATLRKLRSAHTNFWQSS